MPPPTGPRRRRVSIRSRLARRWPRRRRLHRLVPLTRQLYSVSPCVCVCVCVCVSVRSTHRPIQPIISAGLMPTEARGNYLPEPPYLRETIDLSQPASRVDTTCWQLFRPAISTAHFYFFVAEVMSNYLTTDGLKKISRLPD